MSEPDDLAELLAPRPARPDDAAREALFRRTARRVARAPYLRVLTRAAAGLAVLAVGGAVGWAMKPTPQTAPPVGGLAAVPEPVAVPVPVVVPSVVTIPVPVPVFSPPVRPPSERVLSAAAVELRAEQADDPAEAARQYRRAGDLYLGTRDDYQNATRCYQLYLLRAGDVARSPDPGDTWLLTRLKNAAFKEKSHAPRSGG